MVGIRWRRVAAVCGLRLFRPLRDWLLSSAPVPQRSIAGLFSSPSGLDCATVIVVLQAGLFYRPAGLDFAPVLLRRPVRPTGAIDTSPPFQRWVR